MKKSRPFDEAKPRTPKSEARQREIQTARDIARLLNLEDEEEYKTSLEELYGITPGHPRYDKAMAAWQDFQRGRL
jgi:hypothetical protein